MTHSESNPQAHITEPSGNESNETTNMKALCRGANNLGDDKIALVLREIVPAPERLQTEPALHHGLTRLNAKLQEGSARRQAMGNDVTHQDEEDEEQDDRSTGSERWGVRAHTLEQRGLWLGGEKCYGIVGRRPR